MVPRFVLGIEVLYLMCTWVEVKGPLYGLIMHSLNEAIVYTFPKRHSIAQLCYRYRIWVEYKVIRKNSKTRRRAQMLISLDALKLNFLWIQALHNNANGVNNDSPGLLVHDKCWIIVKSTQSPVWIDILQIQVESNVKCLSRTNRLFLFSKLEKRRLSDPKTRWSLVYVGT